MEKLTISISPEEWGTLATKYNADSKKVTLADFTEGTVNVDTDVTSSLTKRNGSTNYNVTLLGAAPKDQFEAIFSDGAHHLLVVANGEIRYSSGDTLFNSIVNGTGFSAGANFEFATTQDRVYGGNAVNSPIVYDRATNYGGVVYTAPRIRPMGAQAPSSAPTAGAPTAGGAVPNGAHTYKITYLYYDSEESNGSPASGVQTAGAGNNTIPLTTIPIGGYGVTARKIYRDNNDGLWLHIATLANNTATTFNDTLLIGVTPTEIPTLNNVPPSFGLITTWLDKQWLARVPGDPYTLFYTETSQPDIVRPANQVLCNQEDAITAFIVYFGRLIVFNRRSMGQILGTSTDTFRYSAIPSSIGCVDNRTLQIRVIEGVPLLIWLSDRGFYSYDGNSINYISEEIEDLVNFNIQQALQQKNSNTQSSQAQFQAGVSSAGIDLLTVPGSITTSGYDGGTTFPGTNPRRTWDDQTDWENGSVKTNVVTRDGTNQLKNPTRFAPAFSEGSLSGLNNNTTTITIPTTADFVEERVFDLNRLANTNPGVPLTAREFAFPIIPPRSGTIISAFFSGYSSGFTGNTQTQYLLYSDSLGSPGALLFSGAVGNTSVANNDDFGVNRVVSFAVTGGVKYWLTLKFLAIPNAVGIFTNDIDTFSGGQMKVKIGTGAWLAPTFVVRDSVVQQLQYDFSANAIPASGQYVSQIFDTKSIYIAPTLSITHTGSYPAGGSFGSGPYSTSGVTQLEGSNDPTFSGGAEVTEQFSNVNGAQNFTLSGKRYWRIRLSLSTTDNRATPNMGLPILKFNLTCTWESEAIDMTADVTTYNALNIVSSTPAGTSITLTIASSADNLSYPDGFVSFGTVVVRRYAKIRAVLTSTADDITTPTITSISLLWTLVSNLVSAAIDTGVAPPAGWDIFLASFVDNGGTVQFQMRSASTLIGLSSATFFAVTPADFPNAVTPFQFAQWKVILTSSDGNVPVIDSVTVQWLIAQVTSIRPASIFVDSRYYVALALVNETTNTVLLELDLNGKWRRHRGLNIGTFSYFFNRPYLGLATSGQIRKFLEGFTDAGVAIEFDVRFKASDYSTQYQNHSSQVKVVGEIILRGINTGAIFQLSYSVDMGDTFIPMLTSSGASTYTTTTDGMNFYERFRPVWDGSNQIGGRTIMYRLYSNDLNQVEIHGLEAIAFLRRQAPVITG